MPERPYALARCSVPGSGPEWHLTSEALEDLARQAPGLPVTVGYDSERVVGRVTSAEVVDDELRVVLGLTEDPPEGCELGPGFVPLEREGVSVRRAELREVSLLTPPPYVPMRVPGAGEVLLPRGTLFIPVAPEALERMGEGWSPPLRVRLSRAENGLVDMQLKEEPGG